MSLIQAAARRQRDAPDAYFLNDDDDVFEDEEERGNAFERSEEYFRVRREEERYFDDQEYAHETYLATRGNDNDNGRFADREEESGERALSEQDLDEITVGCLTSPVGSL